MGGRGLGGGENSVNVSDRVIERRGEGWRKRERRGDPGGGGGGGVEKKRENERLGG